MSDTPRTDAAVAYRITTVNPHVEYVAIDFARTLERELTREKAARHSAETALNDALVKLHRYQCLDRGETPPP